MKPNNRRKKTNKNPKHNCKKYKNTRKKITVHSKNKKKNNMRKIMKGGGQINLAVDETRFDIALRTGERSRPEYVEIMQMRFVIVTDKTSNKQYIVDADTNDEFFLFLFENDKFYAYYINYNDRENSIRPIRTDEYIDRQLSVINNDSLDLYEKIDELTEIGINLCINLAGHDYNEVKREYDINITNALSKINELNKILQIKCPNLELKLNFLIQQPGIVSTFYRINYLTLCLYNQGNCVSSIMCKLTNYPYYDVDEDDPSYNKPIPNSFEISSETNSSVQNRKFNKLLRAVLIIIGNDVIVNGTHIQNVLSEAINPISAWLLLTYYNAEIVDDEFKKFIKKIKNKQDKSVDISKHLLNEYMKDRRSVETRIELNDVNIRRATDEFNLTVSTDPLKSINCVGIEQAWNNRKIHRNNEDMDMD